MMFRFSGRLQAVTSFFILSSGLNQTCSPTICESFSTSDTTATSNRTTASQASYQKFVSGPFPRNPNEELGVVWNENWDQRHDLYLKSNKSLKGIHQIILIRHGQYIDEPEDHQRKLTDLGRLQATMTGKRLTELIEAGIIFKPKRIYYSTMTRATETWEMIKPELTNHLPALSHIECCSMIREGAVCLPVPPSELWKPHPDKLFKDQQRVGLQSLSLS